MGSIDHQDTMWSTIMPHLSLDYALTIMNTPPLASRRDHWNSKRPCGARLRGQDGHCHTKPSRGTSFNLFPLSMHWFIMSFRNIGFLSVRLFPNLQTSFWQSSFFCELWQSICILDKIFLSFGKVFLHFRLSHNLQISFWQSRELKPDLISPPHTLTSMIPGFHFSIW